MTQPREVGYGLIEPIVIEIRRYFINFRLMLLDGESLGNKKKLNLLYNHNYQIGYNFIVHLPA